MRFNDQLQTILAARPESTSATVTLWRQCVDLLAQHDRPGWDGLEARHRDALLGRLEMLRRQVSEHQRIATVVDLGGRLKSPALIRFFAKDRPAIAAAAMSRARLPDLLWPGLVPALGPTARNALRNRRDLGEATRRALAAYGPTDLALPAVAEGADIPIADDGATEISAAAPATAGLPPVTSTAPAADAGEAGQEQDGSIRRLVERIQAFTATRAESPRGAAGARAAGASRPITLFRFSTDSEGVIVDVDGAPRGALVGLSIAEIPSAGESGPDGYVVGAFGRRGPFAQARFMLADGGVLEGEWRLSGAPHFDGETGRFRGYRGEARRPQLVDQPPRMAGGQADEESRLSADSLRQLVHELRTPLNAIMGFAEIIEGQLFGPAPEDYRTLASNIVVDARKLLVAFDDLDLASRMSRGDVENASEAVNVAGIASAVAERFAAEGHPVSILSDDDEEEASAWMNAVQAERMIHNLFRTLASVAAPEERLLGRCARMEMGDGAEISLAMQRPAALAGIEAEALFDPGYGPDGSWPDAPLLGVGFSLRLVRAIAEGAGGRLRVDPDRLDLRLPAFARPRRQTVS